MTNLVVKSDSNQVWLDSEKYDQAFKAAAIFAKSSLVPSAFRGKIEDCFIVCQMAFRVGIDPMMALQNMYLIDGRPAMSAQLAIALANRSGRLDRPITYEMSGQGAELRCVATSAVAGTEIRAMAGMELKRNSPAWAQQPDQMLRYRAALKLIRSTIPDAIFGLHSVEEWEDAGDDVQVRKPHVAAIAQAVAAPAQPARVVEVQEETPEPVAQAPRRGRPPKAAKELLRTEPPTPQQTQQDEEADSDIPY
jgi:hypothetical protein